MTKRFQAGRLILPALLCALTRAAAAPPVEASVWPENSGRRSDGALQPAGAQRAKAFALFARASREMASRGAAEALPLFKEVIALDPANAKLAARVAAMADAAGHANEARAMLEEAVKRNPGAEGPAVALAKFLLERQQDGVQSHAEALTTVRQLIAKFPGSPETCGLAVRMYVSDQRRDDAQAAVRQTIESGGRSAAFWLAMVPVAREAFPLDDPDTRAEHFRIVSGCVEKAVALAPGDAAVVEAAADFYARLRMPDKAAAFYRKLEPLQPGNLTARRKLGECLRLTGDSAGARKLFEGLLRIDPSDAVAHRTLAAMLEGAGESKAALRHRIELLRIDGSTAEQYLKLADQLAEAGMPDERRLTLERGCFAHPHSARLAIAFAGALHRGGQIPEALAMFEKAVTLASKFDPDALDDAYYLSRAACAQDAGENETAAVHYRRAIDKTPKGSPVRAVPAYCGLAMLWLEPGVKLEEARELLRLASALKKDDAGVSEALGLYAARKGDWELAVKEYLRAESLAYAGVVREPANSRLTCHLAEALAQTGRKDEAIARLEKAVALPDAGPALRAKLESMRGTTDEVKSSDP